jgi:hypothetical protein
MNNHTQNVNWSDDDSSGDDNEYQDSTVGSQPNRDFPPSDDENESEEEEYDMDSIRQKMIDHSTWADMFKTDDMIKTKESKNPNILKSKTSSSINNIKNLPTYEKRKFNPKLPAPDKYKKNYLSNGYKINKNEFPSLK